MAKNCFFDRHKLDRALTISHFLRLIFIDCASLSKQAILWSSIRKKSDLKIKIDTTEAEETEILVWTKEADH